MATERLQIYSQRQLTPGKERETLEAWKTSRRNKTLISGFLSYLGSKKGKELRQAKLSSQLRRMCLKLDKDLDQVTKLDLINLLAYYNGLKEYSEATKADYRRTIKQFYRWFSDDDPRLDSDNREIRREAQRFYAYLEKEIKCGYLSRRIDPSTIITDADATRLILEGCVSLRERAFISFLHETGCRIDEVLNMRLKDITLGDRTWVTVDGKTGLRSIPLVKSVAYLSQYIELNPFRANKMSFVWLCESNRTKNQPMLYPAAKKLISRVFERAGLQKQHNPHWFRHSRASLLAPHLTEPMLCDFMGWERGSKQVRTYVHLCKAQLEEVYLSAMGVKPLETEKADQVMVCRCGAPNPSQSRYCFKCGSPLSVEIAIQDKELVDTEINKTMQFFMEMAKNPELMARFEAFKRGG